MVAKQAQHVAPNYIVMCWVEMLRSSGRDFKLRPDDRNSLKQHIEHCLPSICKLWLKDRNIWMQHIAALLGATS